MAGGGTAGSPSVQELVNGVERRAARNLEASNSAIAAHIGALKDRLKEVENKQRRLMSERERIPVSAPVGLVPAGVVPHMPIPAPSHTGADDRQHSHTSTEHSSTSTGHIVSEDPDEKYRWYAMFVAVTQKNIECVGIQTWSLCYSTRRDTSTGAAIGAMMPSIFVLLFQCTVLIAVSTESLHPTCSRNEDCRSGMWCAPSKGWGSFTRSPGMCDDCLWATLLDNLDKGVNTGLSSTYTLTSRYADSAALAAFPVNEIENSLASAAAHCLATDAYANPAKCDYYKYFLQQLTVGPFLLFLFVAFIVLFNVVIDMDRVHFVSDMFSFRVKTHVSRHGAKITVRALGWLVLALRKFVLPGTLVFAFSSIVLVSPPSPGVPMSMSIVLAGLVVILLYRIDNLMAHALLTDGAKAHVREAFADFEREETREDVALHRRHSWMAHFFHRFMGVVLAFLVFVQVLASESLMDGLSLFRLDWDKALQLTENKATLTCTNIPVALAASTIMVTVTLAFAWTLSAGLAGASSFGAQALDMVASPILALLVLPVFALILLQIQYVRISTA